MPKPRLILASGSPRRQALLQQMGVVFDVKIADIDESMRPQETALAYVQRCAAQKAKKVQRLLPECAILAADTIVLKEDVVFTKPQNYLDACRIWRELRNTKHQVVTAIHLSFDEMVQQKTVSTIVEFANMSERQMQKYWRSGEPIDKAGAYAIQGLGSVFVKKIEGSYSNVVGLPLAETHRFLEKIEHHWL